MNTEPTYTLNLDDIRALLQNFWSEMLEIAPSAAGLSVAVPLCYPDGWQVLLDLRPSTPGVVRISDNGRTLHWLDGKLEKKIKVDYFAAILRPVAIEVISRRGNITSYMEQLGFRWGGICVA